MHIHAIAVSPVAYVAQVYGVVVNCVDVWFIWLFVKVDGNPSFASFLT